MGWFSSKRNLRTFSGLKTDLHSHLLPGLDDGVSSLEESEQIIRLFEENGYQKMITTPHVMSDYYRNNTEGIEKSCKELVAYLNERGIGMEIRAAAEYYLDETVMEALETGQPLLTLSGNFLLFETNFMTEPLQLKDFIFKARTKGYQPVLAHPERYLYLQTDFSKAEDLLERGVFFQLNMGSLCGQYARGVQRVAAEFVNRGWVHFLGSDCHNLPQATMLMEGVGNRHVQKALSLPLLNSQL